MALSLRCKSATKVPEDPSRASDGLPSIKPTDLLREPKLDDLVIYMRELKPLKIVVISGGRISAPLGIFDYRSPDVGLYHAPFEEGIYYCDVFNKKYFMRNPAPLYKITSRFLSKDYKPSFSHYFIAFLEHKHLLLKNYTLNMDDLEKTAGITRYTQLYGNFYSFVCIKCDRRYSLDWTKEILDRKRMPVCIRCASLIKPDIFLHGEQLPLYIYDEFETDINECKLLILMGTTLSNEPMATFMRGMDFEFPRVYINDTEPYDFGDFHFYCKHEHSDVIWFGNIDTTCKKLVKLLGWAQELLEFTKQDLMGPEWYG